MIGIGIDIGGTFVKFFVSNEKQEILLEQKKETTTAKTTQEFVAIISDFINSVKDKFQNETISVAMGAPGDVDSNNGVLRYNPNLKFENTDNWPLSKQIYEKTGILPHLINDATVAAWGVYEYELKRKAKNLLVVTLGTGVGGGLIINNELFQGTHGTAGEIGHTKIADIQSGPLCGCGARGCLEAFVGTIGLKRRALELVKKYPESILASQIKNCNDFKIHEISKAADKGCQYAKQLWEETGYYLGIGIANFSLILDLDTVVLTGGVSGASSYFMPSLKKVLNSQQIKTPFTNLNVLISSTQNIGGIGAALYALHLANKKKCD